MSKKLPKTVENKDRDTDFCKNRGEPINLCFFFRKRQKNKDDDGKNAEKQVIPDIFRRTVLSLDKSAKKKYNILKNTLFVCRL